MISPQGRRLIEFRTDVTVRAIREAMTAVGSN